VLDLIKKRRSIREYTHQPVSDADVQTLLEAAMEPLPHLTPTST
jgi:nitroreductase